MDYAKFFLALLEEKGTILLQGWVKDVLSDFAESVRNYVLQFSYFI